MTRILLLSDTHNHFDEKIIKYAEPCDQIWHAGDIGTVAVTDKLKKIKPLIAVYGNIDGMDLRKEFPEHQRFKCEDVNVWMTHIGGSPGRYSPQIRSTLMVRPPALFICGHSHILKVIYDKKYNMLYMNPGAAGNYGDHKVKTMLRFTIDKTEIKDLEVLEFGKL
ncbi:MAG: metallophosphoesterase [Bacteroidetes bacterium]|nr:MAG: metallophosphoesterase [Bacteroidota bacterium]